MQIDFTVFHETILAGGGLGLTSGFLIWFTGYCLSKITHVFKIMAN